MTTRIRAAAATTAAVLFLAAPATADLILDNIGGGQFNATAMSSSQFAPGSDRGISTVDDFTVESNTLLGTPFRLTQVQAAVGGLNNFSSFGLVDSWTVQIYSSLQASTESVTGDVYSAVFDAPDELTNGFGNWFGTQVELATFDIDVILPPGDYYVAVVMGNDGATNGTIAIAGSGLGNGSAWFSGPGVGGSAVPLSNPAAYRIHGEVVPGPGGAAVLAVAGLMARGRRRRARS